MNKIEIVSIKPEEWKLYRDLRLRALKEEPQAFESTYEDNAKHPDGFWKNRLEDTLSKNTQWLVFAKLDGDIVGMVGGFVETEPGEAHIIAVYVTPEARGRGISKLLMQELLVKVKTNKLIKKITVDVNSDQEAAFNLYKNSGFKLIKQYRMVLGDEIEHDICQLQIFVN